MIPAQRSGQPKLDRVSIAPARSGERAAARLRGTLVTLAAAARSSGGTMAITYDWRAGTSIEDTHMRRRTQPTASGAVGMKAARIRSALEGRCVYTIVLMSPILAARRADASCDAAVRSPAAKKMAPAVS